MDDNYYSCGRQEGSERGATLVFGILKETVKIQVEMKCPRIRFRGAPNSNPVGASESNKNSIVVWETNTKTEVPHSTDVYLYSRKDIEYMPLHIRLRAVYLSSRAR